VLQVLYYWHPAKYKNQMAVIVQNLEIEQVLDQEAGQQQLVK